MAERWRVSSGVNETALSQALDDSRLQWVYAERPEETVLSWKDEWRNAGMDIALWQHGRAFGPEAELAWWREMDVFSLRLCVLQGELPSVPAWVEDHLGERLVLMGEREMLLYGERDPAEASQPPAWFTARLPRLLLYPVMDAGHARRASIVVAQYSLDGIPYEQRLVSVHGVMAHG